MEIGPNAACPAAEGWYWTDLRDFLEREWEGEHFVFNHRSGDTHLLNAWSMEILRRLDGAGGRTLDELVAALRAEMPESDTSGLRQAIGSHLVQLEAMGLVNCRRHEISTAASQGV